MWVTLSVAAASLVFSSTTAAGARPTEPPAYPRTFWLENGLQVHLDPMPDRTTVSVMVGYQAGAAAAPPGRHGLAHLVEHLLFRRAGRYGAFAASEYIQNGGGSFNGFTAPHRTWYEATVPPSALDALLLFERERMAFSASEITEEDLRLEQAVVARELEQREGPGRRVGRALNRGLYPAESLWAGVDNEGDEVGRHTLDEARWFLERHYRPDQAALVVAGRFDPETVGETIRRWFGSLEQPSVPPASYAPPPIAGGGGTLAELRVRSSSREERIEYRWQLPTTMNPGERAVVDYVLEGLAHRVRREHAEVARRSAADVERQGAHDLVRIWVTSWASRRLDEAEASFRAQVEATREDPGELVKDRLKKGRVEAELRTRRSITTPEERARVAMHALLDDEAPTLAERIGQIRAVSAERAEEMVRMILSEPPVVLRQIRHDGDFEIEEVDREI